jgi:hypothetical protein
MQREQTQTWIDRLARRLAATTTRRGLARLGLGGALAGLGLSADAALAACKAPRRKCRKGRECCSRRCKRGKCAPCPGGQCPPCAAGLTLCQGACVDLKSNTDHCGLCDFACLAGQSCTDGFCICPNCATGCCDGATCRDGTTDQFCGGRGGGCMTCSSSQACVDKDCVDRPCGQGGPCRVFVTSTTHTGNFGGIAGADAICRNLAAAANLPGAGSYMAWLSDATVSPATRFHRSTGPYLLVGSSNIAENWDDLTNGSIATPLKRTETGQAIHSTNVWTSTLANGNSEGAGSEFTCGNWTNAAATAGTGWSDSVDAAWTDIGGGVTNCTFSFPFYCFQQP